MSDTNLDTVWHHVQQLERLVHQMAQLQLRQIDRERNVPGTDPAELLAIDTDLTAMREIARRLAELQPKAAR